MWLLKLKWTNFSYWPNKYTSPNRHRAYIYADFLAKVHFKGRKIKNKASEVLIIWQSYSCDVFIAWVPSPLQTRHHSVICMPWAARIIISIIWSKSYMHLHAHKQQTQNKTQTHTILWRQSNSNMKSHTESLTHPLAHVPRLRSSGKQSYHLPLASCWPVRIWY